MVIRLGLVLPCRTLPERWTVGRGEIEGLTETGILVLQLLHAGLKRLLE